MMFKVDNKDKIMMYSFCSGVFIVNLGHMSLLFYVSYVLKIKCLFTNFGVLIGTYSKILLSPVTDVLTLSSKMCPVKGKTWWAGIGILTHSFCCWLWAGNSFMGSKLLTATHRHCIEYNFCLVVFSKTFSIRYKCRIFN